MLNLDRVQRISEGDKEFESILIKGFLKSVNQYMQDISLHVKNLDADNLGYSAHTLKGACKNVGAESFADLAYQLEECAKINNFDKAQKKYADLIIEHQVVNDFFNHYLGSGSAN